VAPCPFGAPPALLPQDLNPLALRSHRGAVRPAPHRAERTTAGSAGSPQHLPPVYASRLFDAQAAGATEQQFQAIAAEGLQEIYFKDRGRRAADLEVEFTDIDYVELDF
jgi:hypothetical protein